MKITDFGDIKHTQVEDVYGKVTFNDGTILYMGHPRPALSSTLVKADGTKFRICDKQEDDGVRKGWAITWEEWKSWGGDFRLIGERGGKPVIKIDGGQEKVLESAIDVSNFLCQVHNKLMAKVPKNEGMTEKELDELGEYAPL